MYRLLAMACLAVIVLSYVPSAGANECRDDPEVVGQCFTVHGRVAVGADMTTDLWPVGTKRLLGIQYPPESVRNRYAEPFIPENLKVVLNPETAVFGDFVVCPFTTDVPGRLRFVCIQSASHLVARRWWFDTGRSKK